MKLLFLGDSNTDCGHCFSKDNLGNGYVKMVDEILREHLTEPIQTINGGTDGFTFPRIYRKWKTMWAAPFDTVVLLGGINEVGKWMNTGGDPSLLADSEQALNHLISGIFSAGCSNLIVLEPFLFRSPAYLIEWQDAFQKMRSMIQNTVSARTSLPMTNEGRLIYVPTMQLFEHRTDCSDDGIHLTASGHRILADAVASVLLNDLR